jgi:two-component system NarL family sensor kinase
MLDAAADDIRLALRVPYVQLHGTNGTLAQAGQQPKWNDVDERTLIHRSAEVGRLVVSLRRPGVPFDEREHRLLDDLGRQLGAALHGVRLADDLQRSREQLVIAREQERQRLHRDLHDGLGPSLGAAVLSLDAIRKSLPEGTPKTAAMIDTMKAGLRESVADVRRVIYELRPPALDELGLVGAIARQATALGHHGNMKLELIAPNDLPRLEPALEVAAYRLTSEALNNAVRHSHANHVTVDITLNGALRIAVTDDGIGMQPDSVAGIGLSSMRQRAEELGGTFSITSTHGLTTVNAEFPADRLRPDAP